MDMDNANKYPVGSHWVFFIPPGWLVGATVSESDGGSDIALKNVAYLESSAEGRTNVGDVALATTAQAQLAACTQSYQLPDGTRVRVDAILMATPAALDMRALVTRNAAKAIKGAR